MCGINGYFGFSDSQLIGRMNNEISHRGPDGSGIYVDAENAISLGHTRLSIIDLSTNSSQPIHSQCNNYILIFNGEIYNYLELREKLIEKNYNFSSAGDGEVLLNLWIEYGADCLSLLDGIYSFAIFDKMSRRLFLVRDEFGIKPLYYCLLDGAIIFSSEIKAILTCEKVSKDIDLGSVADYLTYLWCPGENTILSSVKKVKPGHFMEIRDGELVDYQEFYKLPAYNPRLGRKSGMIQVQKALEKSVQVQMQADVEVGAFLSGGLDSSLICSLAKINDQSFASVFTMDTGGNNDGFTKDLPFAKQVALDLNLELNIIKIDANDITLLPLCIYYLDEPQADPAIINTYKICEAAKLKGVKVLLSGVGGDDVFTGYRRHAFAGLALPLSKFGSPFLPLMKYFKKCLFGNSSSLRRVNKILGVLNTDTVEMIVDLFKWIEPSRLGVLFSPDIENKSYLFRTHKNFKNFVKNTEGNFVEKTLMLDKSFFLPDHNLNYTDKMSMAHGVEVRVPFVTKRVLSVASWIPTNLKIAFLIPKYFLKKSARPFLSDDVIYRKKTGFGAPVRQWVEGPLKPHIERMLSPHVLESRGIFSWKEVKKLIEDNEKNRGDYSYTIFALLCLEIWMKIFIDGEKPENIF